MGETERKEKERKRERGIEKKTERMSVLYIHMVSLNGSVTPVLHGEGDSGEELQEIWRHIPLLRWRGEGDPYDRLWAILSRESGGLG